MTDRLRVCGCFLLVLAQKEDAKIDVYLQNKEWAFGVEMDSNLSSGLGTPSPVPDLLPPTPQLFVR